MQALYTNGNSGTHVPAPGIDPAHRSRNFIAEIVPQRRLEDMVLSDICREVIGQLIEEQQRSSLLRANGLDPRHRVLLIGPPGNGKTSMAEAIAEALALPLFVVRYEAMIGSYLGETASRLKMVFDYARTTPCVLFFDEFDAVGKRERRHPRDGRNQTGCDLLVDAGRRSSELHGCGRRNKPFGTSRPRLFGAVSSCVSNFPHRLKRI